MQIITTIPPYAPYIREIAAHPAISGLRFNTVMPVKGELTDILQTVKTRTTPRDLWVDLKCRQLRVSYGFFFSEPESPKTYTVQGETLILDPSRPKAQGVVRTPPWADITIDRKITLDFSKGPVKCWFHDGTLSAHVVEIIDGNRLIMLDGPQKIVGGGESINITDPSLEVEGYFTDLDLRYIKAAGETGIHHYMVSFVEENSDLESLLEKDPHAVIVAKIESLKGLQWVAKHYSRYRGKVRLMAARGDLYTEVGRPDHIVGALKEIISADPGAIAASRILGSLKANPRPACADIMDLACLMQMGYRSFMLGDDICFNRELLLLALDIVNAMAGHYIPGR